MQNEIICVGCDAAGITVSLDENGTCPHCDAHYYEHDPLFSEPNDDLSNMIAYGTDWNK
jgi:hypothetical protein